MFPVNANTLGRRRLALVAAATSVMLVATAAVGAGDLPGLLNRSHSAPAAGSPSTVDWASWMKDLAGSRHNGAETAITPATVGRLKLKWAYSYPAIPNAREGSQPAVVGGMLYVGAPDGKFLALDARTGKTAWTFDTVPTAGPSTGDNPNLIRDGAAVVGDSVYFGDSRGFVYSVDRRDGKLLWATKMDTHPATWMTGSPLVYEGKVYIGVSSDEAGSANDPTYACCSFSGHVDALDAATGKVLWKHLLMPPATRIGTWPTGAAKYGPAGAAVWASPVIDPTTRTLYIGTGNAHIGGGGDIDSVLALNIDDGSTRWKRQMIAVDDHDQACTWPDPQVYCPSKYDGTAKNFDFGATANLFTVNGRELVGIAQKAGLYYAFDARTGQTVWQTRLATPDLSYQDPGSYGTPWGSSYDGHQIYVATWRGHPATIYALDPADGHVNWKAIHPADGCSTGGAAMSPQLCERAFPPAVTTTDGLLYEGSSDGKIRIYSTKDGSLLWTYDAVRAYQGVNGVAGYGKAISGNGGAVVVDGMLYVQAGYYPFYPSDKGTVLLAFGL